MTPLIIAADDYAQSAAIDQGILALVARSRLTAFSCLVLSPRWPAAARQITPEVRSKADIGLHLDFTQYAQNAPAALPWLIVKSTLRSLSHKAVRAAIMTQCNRFEDALGTMPDYVDGHQHVHQLPQIREALIDVLTQRYQHRLPWLRIARPPAASGFKAAIIGALGSSALAQLARQNGIRHTSALLGVYDFKGNTSEYGVRLAGWLEQASRSKPCCALMCHPAMEIGVSADDLQDPIHAARLNEYRIFANDRFPSLMATYAVEPARGDQL